MPTLTEIDQETTSQTHFSGPYVVILYNDEYHTFDEVVLQVQKATGCALQEALGITITAHETGRAIAYEGDEEKCEQVARVLREIRLQVETDRAL